MRSTLSAIAASVLSSILIGQAFADTSTSSGSTPRPARACKERPNFVSSETIQRLSEAELLNREPKTSYGDFIVTLSDDRCRWSVMAHMLPRTPDAYRMLVWDRRGKLKHYGRGF